MNQEFYEKHLGISSVDDLVACFTQKLTPTNRTPEFYVDWVKVRRNISVIKVELALWDSLINSEDIKEDFRGLITDYPEVLKTFPILLAIRDREFPSIENFGVGEPLHNYNFNLKKGDQLPQDEVEKITSFAEKSGVFSLFHTIRNFHDYVMGVEVGMDTNARKNRSGDAMEQAIKPFIETLSEGVGFDFLFQKKFSVVEKEFGINPPGPLTDRKADFILHKGDNLINIEVNYFSGSGSKPEEIVDSYINRRNELTESNWNFIWITDGNVWKTSSSQLKKGFEKIDYILNLDFVGRGLLEAAIKEIFNDPRK